MKATYTTPVAEQCIYAPKNEQEFDDIFDFAGASYERRLEMLDEINSRDGDQREFVLWLIGSMKLPITEIIELKKQYR